MEDADFFIKRGDTSPSIQGTVEDQDGSAIDLTGAAIKFYMKDWESGSVIVEGTGTLVNAGGGVVRYDWGTADTATAGLYEAEFEITYSNGQVETFPNEGYKSVSIDEDIK